MGLDIRIRYADKDDAELIADMSRKTFYDTFAEHNTIDDMNIFLNQQFTRESLLKEVGVPSNIFILAFEGDEPAGYAKLREGVCPKQLNRRRAFEIARIYSRKEMIGKGVGKALMQESIRIAKEKKKEVVWLAVWEKNQRAIEFYSKWGFEIFDKQYFLLGTDLQNDWIMKKHI